VAAAVVEQAGQEALQAAAVWLVTAVQDIQRPSQDRQ